MKNLTFIVPMLTMTALSAQAQSRMEDSTMQIKEVVISTTRIPEIRSNSASTVTIIGHQQIVEMSKIAPDMSKILGLLTPGMALSSNTTSSRSQSLRGRSVLVLIDGIPQDRKSTRLNSSHIV